MNCKIHDKVWTNNKKKVKWKERYSCRVLNAKKKIWIRFWERIIIEIENEIKTIILADIFSFAESFGQQLKAFASNLAEPGPEFDPKKL